MEDKKSIQKKFTTTNKGQYYYPLPDDYGRIKSLKIGGKILSLEEVSKVIQPMINLIGLKDYLVEPDQKILVTYYPHDELYGDSIFDSVRFVDKEKYRGKGRPRKIDYMTFQEASKKLNSYILLNLVDRIAKK